MLNGLEITIVKLKDLDNSKTRIDAEYYKKDYLKATSKILKRDHKKIKEIISTFTDFHSNGSYETIRNNVSMQDEVDYAYIVRPVDILKDDFENNIKYVSKSAYEFLSKSKIFGGELLINKIGNAGQVYIMPNLNRPVTLGMNMFALRFKKGYSSNTYYIFFNTNIGRNIIEQKVNGAVPLSIDKESVKETIVPIFSSQFQDKCDRLIGNYFRLQNEGKEYFKKAEFSLLKELDLDIVNIANLNYSKVRFSSIAQRMDAEYYHPRYYYVLSKLGKFKTKLLSEIAKINKSIEPGSDYYQETGIPFVRVSDFNKFGISSPQIHLPVEFLTEKLKPKKNTILLSKDGSIGIAYKVEENLDIITSGAILHLKIKDKEILPDYLTLVLNSVIVQLQAERDSGGSIIEHWRISDIEKVVIPLIPLKLQTEISEKVQESFRLRKQSKQLLDIAKLGVEKAIEDSESVAEKWINSELEKIGVEYA